MNKFEKLKKIYNGIEFIPCPFNKNKFTWKWKDFSAHCVKKENLEFSIKNEIENYNKMHKINNDEKRILGKSY